MPGLQEIMKTIHSLCKVMPHYATNTSSRSVCHMQYIYLDPLQMKKEELYYFVYTFNSKDYNQYTSQTTANTIRQLVSDVK